MTGAEIPLIIAAGAGTGMSIYGQVSAAESQADAANRNADLKRQQATELLQREQINEQIIREQSKKSQLTYSSEFASTGREGAGIGGMLEIKRASDEQISNSARDAQFKAKMITAGADIDQSLASDALTASYISGAGTLLSSGAQMYNLYRKPGTPSALPKD